VYYKGRIIGFIRDGTPGQRGEGKKNGIKERNKME
jgi:hypothetical protein